VSEETVALLRLPVNPCEPRTGSRALVFGDRLHAEDINRDLLAFIEA
jgi:hypothetical protein